jgi:hypothetical protein
MMTTPAQQSTADEQKQYAGHVLAVQHAASGLPVML